MGIGSIGSEEVFLVKMECRMLSAKIGIRIVSPLYFKIMFCAWRPSRSDVSF